MKFLLLSDIHLEFQNMSHKKGEVPECDVVLLAGDIGPGGSGYHWAERNFSAKRANYRQVLYVAGNHEFYTNKYGLLDLNDHLLAKTSNHVWFLQNSVREFPDEKIAVLGCTLWTGFDLNGNEPLDILRASDVMNDYKWCSYTRGDKLRPEHVKDENTKSYEWLNETIGFYQENGWKTVVMTHHAPSQLSCSPEFRGGADNVYYANRVDADYNFNLPNVWVHGHMHSSSDYMLGDCRVLTNPRGYAKANGEAQNPDFDMNFIFEV